MPTEALKRVLRGLIPAPNWNSCVCLALADQEDVLALLVLASEKKNAFGSRAVGEIIPVKSIAALAIAQHLHHARHDGEPVTATSPTRAANTTTRASPTAADRPVPAAAAVTPPSPRPGSPTAAASRSAARRRR